MLQGCESPDISQGNHRWHWDGPLFFYVHIALFLSFFCFLELQLQGFNLTLLFHTQNFTLKSDSGEFRVKHDEKSSLVREKLKAQKWTV